MDAVSLVAGLTLTQRRGFMRLHSCCSWRDGCLDAKTADYWENLYRERDAAGLQEYVDLGLINVGGDERLALTRLGAAVAPVIQALFEKGGMPIDNNGNPRLTSITVTALAGMRSTGHRLKAIAPDEAGRGWRKADVRLCRLRASDDHA